MYAQALSTLGRDAEATEQLRAAITVIPNHPGLLTHLGSSLEVQGRYDEALHHHRQALALDPKNPYAQSRVRAVMVQLGKADEVLTAWLAALETNPLDHTAFNGYAELCVFLGNDDAYQRARQSLLSRFGTTTNPRVAELTARACLLRPVAGDELSRAVALAERAVAVDRSKYLAIYPYFLFAQGLAKFRQGQHDQAIATMRGDASRVLGPAPRLVIAMALHRSGQEAEARKTLAAAVLAHDWRANQAGDQNGWIFHVLRREAETMILPNLPAFLNGTYQPQDNDERLGLLGVCQFMGRTHALSRLYADAFAADPRLAEDVAAGHRYNAARAATLASCGRGEDARGHGEEEKRRWRAQARQWLWADLTAWGKALDTDPTSRDLVRQTLTRWRSDPDLAGLREPIELDKLPADERKEWRALWRDFEILLERVQAPS
jgi:serine/threonine-protein kinase